MTAKEMSRPIGLLGTLTIELSMTITVKILDMRQVFDRQDALVTPVHGTGQRWIDFRRLNPVILESPAPSSGAEKAGGESR